ncbi:MAG: hypothetical protein ACRDJE_00360 [Dehalococcoidia bacterium]
MVTTALVDEKIRGGQRLLEVLDKNKIQVDVALWLLDPNSESWRLVLASRQLENLGPGQAYRAIQSILRSSDIPGVELREISVRPPSSQLIKALRATISSGRDATRMHLSGNIINGVYIDDAYIYRVR